MKKAIFFSAVTLLAACQMEPPTTEDIASKEPSAYETQEDKNPLVGHGIINYHMTNIGRERSDMYDTNQNPNSYRNLTTKRFTISDDQDKIREAVKDASGLTPQFVSINGNTAWVHVDVPRDHSKEERQELRNKIEKAVQLSVPRYHLRVRMDDR
ncbi:hypothetical protein [Alkalihalobacillus sp. AL-G]|uniref:hypothetical protein n=1 Tax=Alkalihalobacillus sp. AL-G TaxID=2926399 RepID=UPI00272D5EF9|nr:hypothetical protein [Alkalihalobacillus sp. AL-G]WLD93182.1 hypothetical protein MOJ78_19660 [Alkalihalobacillus sp. AL-G]